ncbi:MAG: GYD domain-containing protein [Acidobacteriota bacterium]|nr:GYD domain-containing protein [Acidobacteriota bacterium]
MASYMLQVSYTQPALAALSKKPEDRSAIVGKAIAKLGGSLKSIHLSLGDYDVVAMIEMPDNISATALSIALGAGGACKAIKTTPLLTIAEAIAAMKMSSKSGYKPVGR